MKVTKLIIVWVIVTVIMIISWIVGSLIGNALTGSVPPPPQDSAHAGLAFLAVCAFNAVLITMLIGVTRVYAGVRRRNALILYVFVIQYLLPMMETYFFASGIGISYRQTTAILISGAVVSIITVMLALIAHKKLIRSGAERKPLGISFIKGRKMLGWVALLILIAYPLLYMVFGYYVAWQNEALRIFYTSSATKASFGHQLVEAFRNGLYFFQVLRALIWTLVTVPVVVMLKGNAKYQFLVVGMLSALLPSSLLFIPNPYMPENIAMTHFVETSISNLLWGWLMVAAIKRGLGV
jgi:hypothetical protein